MFKGIIVDIGTIVDIYDNKTLDKIFHIKSQRLLSIKNGDSISCSGICLTVTTVSKDVFTVQVSQETIDITNVNTWKIGVKINLEQAMRLDDRIDGHLIQGHVDGVAKILEINQKLDSHELTILCTQDVTRFIVKKGSIALDGVSLTINSIIEQKFTINIVPYTWNNTTFQYNKKNDIINLEIDLIARYLSKLIR